MLEKEITWDFSELFSGYNDPNIKKKLEELLLEADYILKEYKGKINSQDFTPNDLRVLFERIENHETKKDELELFCLNSFNANMTLPETKALNNQFRDFDTKISKNLTFLELEIGKLIYENEHFISNHELSNYKHYLEKVYRRYPHKLTEVEEQIILEKDQYGIDAWSQLQGVWLNTRDFKVNVEGEEKTLSYGEANSLLTHPDRDTRIFANKVIYGTLGLDEEIFSSALRSICGDWVNTYKRRKYESAMHHSLIVNDTTQRIIDNLMKTIEQNVNVYRKYLKLKAKLLDLPKLTCADIMAPLPNSPHVKYNWNDAKNLIFEAYGTFDQDFLKCVKDVFEKNHIDASMRKGKRNGAYCAGWYGGKSAFILLSYNGTLSEVYTLTHELGHAIHDYLSSQNQTYLNFHPGYSVAECASTFGELLITDLLLKKAQSKTEKLTILAHILDDAGQAAFQVSARVWFEQSLYDTLELGKNLDGKTIANLWCNGRDKIYGDSVDWFKEMEWEWTMKPHYFRTSLRFYNYPYVYAQLFVYALYRIYKEQGNLFVPKFKQLLSAGGSLSPVELGNLVGLDVTTVEFWKLGIDQYADFVNQLENLM